MSDKRKRERNWEDNSDSGALSPNQLAAAGYGLPDDWLQGVTALKNPDHGIPEGAIVPQEDGSLVVGNVQMTAVGLTVNGEVTSDQWLQVGDFLRQMQGALQWLIGDWINGCERIWGETYRQVVEQTGYDSGTVYNFAYVANSIEFSRRRETLSFGHHQNVASKPPEEQDYWLEQAVLGKWSISQMRASMKQLPPPLSSSPEAGAMQKTLISREKPREFRQFLKLAIKAGQGDVKAKQRALGQIVQYRQWLDDMEQWLKH